MLGVCGLLPVKHCSHLWVNLERIGANVEKIKFGCIVALAWWAAAAATAGEVTLVTGVLGPEGPLYVDGNLYFVGWISNTLSRWDGKASPSVTSGQFTSVPTHSATALETCSPVF